MAGAQVGTAAGGVGRRSRFRFDIWEHISLGVFDPARSIFIVWGNCAARILIGGLAVKDGDTGKFVPDHNGNNRFVAPGKIASTEVAIGIYFIKRFGRYVASWGKTNSSAAHTTRLIKKG